MLEGLCLLAMVLDAKAASFVVSNTQDSGPGSFLQALLDAAQSPGVDEITFSNVSGMITLPTNPPPLADLAILGPGARQLTVVTPNMVVPWGTTSILSGLRLTKNYAVAPTDPLSAALLSNGGTLWLRDCELVSSGGYSVVGGTMGAAINSGGNLIVSGCTIADNSILAWGSVYPQRGCMAGSGGGLYVGGGNAFITNSTFSGNYVSSYLWCDGTGGAVSVNGGTVHFVNCTVADNGAAVGGSIYNAGGSVSLQNTIVTDAIADPASRVTLVGGNLLTNSYAAGLGPLQDNGGPTLTRALAPNSPAINHAQSSGAPATDQRGVARPQGKAYDIGAFEFDIPANYVQLDVAVVGPGTVSRYPDQIFFPSNTVVTLNAVAQEDYTLSAWSGDASGGENPLSFAMDRDKSIVATFQYSPATVSNAPGATTYVLNTNGWGPKSFRQAIRDVNASGGGTIRFSNVTGLISLSLGLPPLEVPFTICGPGASNVLLSIPSSAGAFVVNPGITGTISGLTVQSYQPGAGGAISNAGSLFLRKVGFLFCGASNGGAIYNDGALQVSDCAFSNNVAASGGAIYNSGDLLLNDSVFAGNRCAGVMGPVAGGALYNAAGRAHVEGSVFVGNKSVGASGGLADTGPASSGGSVLGGAMYVSGGEVWLKYSLVCSNEVRGGDGGTAELYHFGGSGGDALGAGIYLAGGVLAISNCALVCNRATAGDAPAASRIVGSPGRANGGAVCAQVGTLVGDNCTFSGNEVRSGSARGSPFPTGGANGLGGAIAVFNGLTILANCTITANRAFGGDAATPGRGLGGGISIYGSGYTGTVALVNTIISGNFGATMGTNGVVADDINGPGQSLGHNIIGTATGFTNFAASDFIGVDPRLGPLQGNGGPTPSHALLAGSPAIDAGAPTSVPFDQRGQPRTIDDPTVANVNGSDGTDIGALEANPFLSFTGVSVVGRDVHVTFTTVSTKTYRLQYKARLSDPLWITLPGDISGTGGIVAATNADVGTPVGFYRIYTQ